MKRFGSGSPGVGCRVTAMPSSDGGHPPTQPSGDVDELVALNYLVGWLSAQLGELELRHICRYLNRRPSPVRDRARAILEQLLAEREQRAAAARPDGPSVAPE